MNINKLYLSVLVAAAVLSGCAEETDPAEVDSSTRISLSKDVTEFTSTGRTASGDDAFRAAVTIVQGNRTNAIGWDFKLDDPKNCADVKIADVTEEFKGTYEGDTRDVTEKGLEIKVTANPEYRRTFTVTVTAADGTSKAFVFTQLGDKADAAVSSEIKDIEFLAEGGSQEIAYITNMGDVYSFSADYDGDSGDWLSWEADAAGTVRLSASKWTDKVNGRNAVFHISVGSAETSMATLDIPVSQLAADEYYFMYGASAAGLAIDRSIQMTKSEKGIYTVRGYFRNSPDGRNAVLFNKDSRELSYPCYALAKDGRVVTLNSASTSLPEGPEIDVDGLRSLTVNFNDNVWTWDRITVSNCLPDSEVSKYRTKSFIARDGSMKVWMIENLRWNGGDITPKLGSPMVPTATGVGSAGTGGYAAANFPSAWDDAVKLNMAYESTEIGGQLQGSDEYGRIYAFSELVTGTPTNGVGLARYEPLPDGWTEGCEITDAVGDTYTIEYINHKTKGVLTGDNDADEQTHPTLKMQIQGICPYGWHIANASDWLDIAYAACKASSGHTFPMQEDQVTYKQFTTVSGTATVNNPVSPRGIGNFAPWLRNKKYWPGGNISDGSDEFGFEYYPLGWRYMTQGYQCYGTRAQQWVPLFYSGTAPFRINVILCNTVTYAEMTNVDNGQAILPVRCVKNYKK